VAAAAVIQCVVLVSVFPFAALLGIQALNVFPSSGGAPKPIASADLSGTGPGALVTATTMPGLTRTFHGRPLVAARVLYRSTEGDTGQPTVVSGSVFIPRGDPPPGGWPVVAFAHGTTGINSECGPSLSDNLRTLVVAARLLTGKGYAVALPDYQGLGAKGVHPYPDSRTAGLNMIDAVRALRHTFPNVSDRWAAVGDSQGAGASWAADEQAGDYAPELHLVGAVATSPASDVSGLADKAARGELTDDQRPVLQLIVETLARLHPDVNRDDFRKGAAVQYWDVLSACIGPKAYQRGSVIKKLGPTDIGPQNPQAVDQLRALLTGWALPQKPLSAPLSVWYGAKDTFIDAEWTTAALKKACASGGVITIELDPNKGHSQADINKQLSWVADRFAGKPPANDC
jgi:pimeloyl-ACP methyl ester carboxylesterase